MQQYSTTVGLDLGDKFHYFHELDERGEKRLEGKISSTGGALRTMFEGREPALVVIETGTHSPWVSRALEGWGHTVLVANARKLRAISASVAKSDRRDAEMLARLGRADAKLLCPIRHRGRKAQSDLAVLRSRDALVSARTAMINHCRGMVKSQGERLPSCSADAFAKKMKDFVPSHLCQALVPVLQMIEELTGKIHGLDREIERLCGEKYPETGKLRAVRGVGALTALAFVLTLEDPERFDKSRSVAAYLGLVPRRDQSGGVDKQLRITKAGDGFARRLLISCSHYILGPFGGESDLRSWGLQLCERGGKNGKKRAVVATARKLSVLLHRLWLSDEPYEAVRQSKQDAA
jgi:transposase